MTTINNHSHDPGQESYEEVLYRVETDSDAFVKLYEYTHDMWKGWHWEYVTEDFGIDRVISNQSLLETQKPNWVDDEKEDVCYNYYN
jgi:hypothetical protein